MAKGHRTRILLSDGESTLDYAYVVRKRDDIYFGLLHSDQKTSYHASGYGHTKERGSDEGLNRWRGPPVGEITSAIEIQEWGSVIRHSRFSSPDHHRHFDGKSSDTICHVDLRELADGWSIRVRLGLVNPEHLGSYAPQMAHDPARVVTFVTSATPWLFVEVGWATGTATRTTLGDVFSKPPYPWRRPVTAP